MAWRPLVKADGAPARPAQHVRHPACTSRGSQRPDDTVVDMSSPGAVLRLRRSWPWRGGVVSITVQRQGACRVWWCVRSAETLLGVVFHARSTRVRHWRVDPLFEDDALTLCQRWTTVGGANAVISGTSPL